MAQIKQDKINPFVVKVKMLRMRLSGALLAKRHNVSRMTVSRAVNGDASAAWLLPKLNRSCNVIQNQRMVRASQRLRQISNPHQEDQSC